MIIAIMQARMSSTRLPGKVLKLVAGQPILQFQIERMKLAKSLDKIVLATSVEPDDNPLEELASNCGIDCYRGSLDDVLDRYYQCACFFKAETIVRITGDCPLIAFDVIDSLVKQHQINGSEFTSNIFKRTFPDGLDTEVMSFAALKKIHAAATSKSDREHVTKYVYSHPDEFLTSSLEGENDYSKLRWTLDTPEDFIFLKEKIQSLPGPWTLWKDILP